MDWKKTALKMGIYALPLAAIWWGCWKAWGPVAWAVVGGLVWMDLLMSSAGERDGK